MTISPPSGLGCKWLELAEFLWLTAILWRLVIERIEAIKMAFPVLETSTLFAIGLYATFAVLYLLMVPLALMYYLKGRWNVAGSVERLMLYGLILVFFPGCLLISPFLNFRPKRREI